MNNKNIEIIKKISKINFQDGHTHIEFILHDKEIKNIIISKILGQSIELLFKNDFLLQISDNKTEIINIINDITSFPEYGSIEIDIILEKGKLLGYKKMIINRFSLDRFNSLSEKELNNLF